ncbi:hypothetical protein F5Y06DRAFT_69440 [Hypoxylon sp. FL0890]|nr:hypothetical protein F5Y06DRAFT_69440 [Hypoxylon sp. FL0890]
MSLLECLPAELRGMIIDECSPRDLLALIAASPIYLGDFTYGRTRILNKRIYEMISQPSHSSVDVALGIVKLCAQRKELAQLHPQKRGQVLVDNLRNTIEGDRRPERSILESLPFLAKVLDVQDEARRLGSWLERNSPPIIQRFGSRRRLDPSVEGMPRDEDLRAVLIFEIYSLSLTISDGDAIIKLRTFWHPYFIGLNRLRAAEWHRQLFTVFHQVLDEHKRIVREVVRDLQLLENLPTTNHPTHVAQRQLLDQRSEYCYCRYMTSLGISPLNRLLDMTQEERNEFTVERFSWLRSKLKGMAWRATPLGLSPFYDIYSWRAWTRRISLGSRF